MKAPIGRQSGTSLRAGIFPCHLLGLSQEWRDIRHWTCDYFRLREASPDHPGRAIGNLSTRRSRVVTRSWSDIAIACIEADFARSADTHLVALPLSGGI